MAIPEKLLDELLNDPEFQSLSSQEQDSLVEQLNQSVSGEIPNTENLLQKAISNQTQPLPFFQGSDIPRVAFQGAQGVVGNAPQNVIENPLTTAMSGLPGTQFKSGAMAPTGLASMVGFGKPVQAEQEAEFLEPQTIGGKIAGTAANIVGSSIFPIASGAKGMGKLFGEKAARRELSDMTLKGTETVTKRMQELFGAANKKFGETLDSLDSAMTTDDFADVLAQTADEIGVSNIPNHPLVRQFESLLERSGQSLSPREVQQQAKFIFKTLGKDEVSKAIFNSKFLDVISEAVPGLRELKKAQAPLYGLAKEAKKFTRGALNKVGKGSMGPNELKTLQASEKNLGLNITPSLIKAGGRIGRAQMAKNVALATGGLGIVGGGLAFLKSLFNNQ